ncbi:MAG: nicotinate-nucleotide--dimethylbenzimidazole phosphoribosyltransferase [Piscinibacter sp.]|jgi:nicotinate-nucleotide--dimethylbenzimidazole phosphoribosyltransferase|uniref:nicotinate-nucleotide--dimethylbenzimidazole phosphoribosyltransferase n=1 Tax=Piscinibacter sp. TaxID=1903157 RepID=UPI001B67BD7C|nr:nicotinate-nucleotide--dimethylbenzimidazole phosphoribosyltransferase [Piscinibacter sp.]MBP5989752.1 nicotinate-nucleotide--dimethylbenzimidazole phosphoribosyltransferase [Piscinibacter sp.]MBP6027093.1 nicotinate-nucleotide--dimethylbenzimidazole phosphoribosyltransferase [Piscinibacter sp.]MBS0433333.1 nicotinate-nucleotide--dimethylbenzimidazole phosphoribosyltransferase [Pseudomonadota bacterium]MBS0440558.1 nicotinate-nucleotide--dimethylbenzimidazole phosphoribosyltransferase [Pseud
MSVNRSLITPTANPLLEQALREKLQRRSETTGSLGELEPLAVRLGLVQNTLKPRFRAPQLVLFASDHGLAVDGVGMPGSASTAKLVARLLSSQLPVSVFARIQGLELSVVDCGIAEPVAPHARLLARKIAHGTRSSRAAMAMSLDQAHAAIRAGMEIADSLPGNAIACAGVGVGAHESAALVLSRLSDTPLQDFLLSGPAMPPEDLNHLVNVLSGAQGRHKDAADPVEVLACFGGFEMAMMVGVMLVAGSKRNLVIADGMTACAALMVASRIAPAVTDYCVYCRSHNHNGLDRALSLFQATALLELGMESTDGTGATLAWPLVRSAAALLTEVAEGEDPGPSQPAEIAPNSRAGSLG